MKKVFQRSRTPQSPAATAPASRGALGRRFVFRLIRLRLQNHHLPQGKDFAPAGQTGAKRQPPKTRRYAKGSPTRGAVAAKPATERLCKSKASPSPSFSPTFCYTDIYQKEGAAHQDCNLPRCPAADKFCAHVAVPAGGGTGNPVLGRMRDHRPFFVAQCSTNSPRRANMWSMGPEPLPRSSMADRQPEIYALARSTAASRG